MFFVNKRYKELNKMYEDEQIGEDAYNAAQMDFITEETDTYTKRGKESGAKISNVLIAEVVDCNAKNCTVGCYKRKIKLFRL